MVTVTPQDVEDLLRSTKDHQPHCLWKVPGGKPGKGRTRVRGQGLCPCHQGRDRYSVKCILPPPPPQRTEGRSSLTHSVLRREMLCFIS